MRISRLAAPVTACVIAALSVPVTAQAANPSRRGSIEHVLLTLKPQDRGALRAGVHPALLPGGRRVADPAERAEVEAVWGAGSVPEQPGRDTAEILAAAACHEVDLLYLIGVDLLRDFPDAALARRALENVRFKVVQDIVSGPFAFYADAMLPAAAPPEKQCWEPPELRYVGTLEEITMPGILKTGSVLDGAGTRKTGFG